MNVPIYTIDTLLLDRCHAESVLLAFVHTILFHRMIYRIVRPKDESCGVYEVLNYVRVDDDVLHQMVREKISSALESLRERDTGVLSIVFYYIRPSGGWWSKEEQVEMERWNIPLQWYELYDRSDSHQQKVAHLLRSMENLLTVLSSAPPTHYPIINRDLPFDIIDSDKTNSFKDIIQFIVRGPPKLGIF